MKPSQDPLQNFKDAFQQIKIVFVLFQYLLCYCLGI